MWLCKRKKNVFVKHWLTRDSRLSVFILEALTDRPNPKIVRAKARYGLAPSSTGTHMSTFQGPNGLLVRSSGWPLHMLALVSARVRGLCKCLLPDLMTWKPFMSPKMNPGEHPHSSSIFSAGQGHV
mmetsp:Transcript_20157/g.36031  ORF Transcript_20157/g.36031 Transcript_20157/m.36031 type:complete len:126 (-) Transcript_20157:1314-1691(-)